MKQAIWKAAQTLLVALFVTCIGHAQDIVGDWQGTLDTGQGQLRLVLHITKAAGGGFGATLDSLDQDANGIPVATVTLKDSKLNLGVDVVNGSYEGKVNADASEIDGTWTQGQSFPLNFKRAAAAPAKTEPKAEPKPAKPSN